MFKLILLENRLTLLNSPFDRLFNTVCDIFNAHPVTLLLHADWVMLKNASNQGGANSVTVAPWQTKSRQRILIASKAAVLKNYLAVSTWILNGSSIEYYEKKHQPFSLSCVRFGSRSIEISG